VLIVLSMTAGMGVGLCGGGVVGLVWTFVINGRYRRALANQNQMREILDRSKRDSLTQLRAAGAELTDWNTEFKDACSGEQQARSLSILATAGHAARP
jgi:hypothetical protein